MTHVVAFLALIVAGAWRHLSAQSFNASGWGILVAIAGVVGLLVSLVLMVVEML